MEPCCKITQGAQRRLCSRPRVQLTNTEFQMEKRLIISASLAAVCLLAICLRDNAGAADDGLLAGVQAPPGSKSLGTQAASSGGQQASFSTTSAPAEVAAFYEKSLPTSGWTVTGSGSGGGSGGGGAGLEATNGAKYLSMHAGGPQGMTYVHVCVWPSRPANDHCG